MGSFFIILVLDDLYRLDISTYLCTPTYAKQYKDDCDHVMEMWDLKHEMNKAYSNY